MKQKNNSFNEKSANEVWVRVYDQLTKGTANQEQNSRIGYTDEILHAFISIENPRERWISSRVPMFNPAFAIAEIVWILNGRNDSKFLNFWNSRLPEYAGKGPKYHGAYGHRLRKNFGFDQLKRAYLVLKNNSSTRQVVLQIWDPNRDFPDEKGEAVSSDIPCNLLAMLKVRNGKLEWQQIMRSNDIILGLPYNLIQFTTLQEVMAGWLNVEVGSYNHLSDSLHIYHKNKSDYSSDLNIEPKENTDDLRLPWKESQNIFRDFAGKLETLVTTKYSIGELEEISNWSSAPIAYQNLLFVICAEAARKKKFYDEAIAFIEKCENPILSQVWDLWRNRFNS